jgi:ferritin-like metal-binding protein YciE
MTDSDDARDTVNDILATGLRNAHAMEAQAKELLERQIERLDDYPELRDRMRRHLAKTEGQQERLEQILRSMNEPR